MKYLLWRDTAHSGAWNMAADRLILDKFGAEGNVIIRFYSWIKPSITCGRNQPLPTPEAIHRPTGGGIVQHGSDTTYTIILPWNHMWNRIRRDECYLKIHSIIAGALLETGFTNVYLQPEQSVVDDRGSMRCFIQPSKHDVMGSRGKLAGAAQWKSRNGILHQGSILSDNPAIPDAIIKVWQKATGAEFIPFHPDIKFYEAIADRLE